MHRAAAFAIAPAGHDDGTRDDAGPALAGPADRFQKLVGRIGVPIGEQYVRIGRQCVDNLAAEYAVLAILGFQVTIAAEGTSLNLFRQGFAKLCSVTAKT